MSFVDARKAIAQKMSAIAMKYEFAS